MPRAAECYKLFFLTEESRRPTFLSRAAEGAAAERLSLRTNHRTLDRRGNAHLRNRREAHKRSCPPQQLPLGTTRTWRPARWDQKARRSNPSLRNDACRCVGSTKE